MARKTLAFTLLLIPALCSLILGLSINSASSNVTDDYIPVGGRIVDVNNRLLGPWIGLIVVISLIVVVVSWRAKIERNRE